MNILLEGIGDDLCDFSFDTMETIQTKLKTI